MKAKLHAAILSIMLATAICASVQLTTAKQITEARFEVNGQIAHPPQTDKILALQWQRTRTYLSDYATLSVSEIREQIPSANFAYVDVWNTVTDSTVYPRTAMLDEYQAAIRKLQNAGFTVIIRIRITGQTTLDPPDKVTFFRTYADASKYWAQFCNNNNIRHFCMGTENTYLEREEYIDYWNDVIYAIRSVYSGVLFYETNYWYQAAGTFNSREQKLAQTWWQNLDYIAVSAYWDIAPHKDATVEEMIARWYKVYWWNQNPVADLQLLSDTHEKQIILVTGLASQDGAAMSPWKYRWDEVIVDLEEQRRWFETFFQVFHDKPFVDGFMIDGGFFTEYNKDPYNNEFTLQNKPAAVTVEAWFAQLMT